MDVEVDVDIDSHFCCLKGMSKSVQVLVINGRTAVVVLTLTVPK